MPRPRTPNKYDSEESSTEEGKRKRWEEEESSDASKKSKQTIKSPDKKRTHKSPGKAQHTEENKIDQILGLLQNLTLEVNQIRAEQRVYNEELKNLKAENESIRKVNNNIKKEYEQIKNELRDTNARLEKIEREKRRNNIIVSGSIIDKSNPAKLKEEMDKLIQDKLEVDVPIKTAYKIGPKMCLIQLESFEDKVKIMQNKKKLKNMGEAKVFINNDLSRKEREVDKQIRKIAEKERKEGKFVKVGYQKMIIEGKEWRWNTEKNTLEERLNKAKPADINPKN